MLPLMAIAIVAFGFCDELFFKLGLYDRDLFNKSVGEQPVEDDPFANEKALIHQTANS